MADQDEERKTGEEHLPPGELRELIRYERGDEVRIYKLRGIGTGAELWRITTYPGEDETSIKEADVTSMQELLELLEDVRRSLKAGGWQELDSDG